MKALWILFLIIPGFLFGITADEIIAKVDDNQVFESQKGKMSMVIERDGKKLTKWMSIYGTKDGNKSFVEFTNPEDKGVKYLKIDKELWIYLPDADDVMKISGHMLRQGMMGSDISYEDLLNDEELEKKYQTKLLGETNLNGVLCYEIELLAKSDGETYYKRKMIVDKEKMIALEFNLYAKSGRLLKTFTQTDIRQYGNRYYAGKMIIRDMKRRDSITTVEVKEMEFDVGIPRSIFSKQNLKR